MHFVEYCGHFQKMCHLQVSGGKGALMDSPIFLCARRDLDHDRFWSGKLAHLVLWDQSLQAADVMHLFQTYATSASNSFEFTSFPSYINKARCQMIT